MDDMRVIGVPRSGTNLAKLMIEQCSSIACHFHAHWWKHAIIPSLVDFDGCTYRPMPTAILFREPGEQIASFFKFSRSGAVALSGADTAAGFATSPIRVRQSPGRSAIGDVAYYYARPLEYWVQYYHAALSWSFSGKVFVPLHGLRHQPALVSTLIDRLHGPGKLRSLPSVPAEYLARNGDGPATDWQFNRSTTLAHEDDAVRRLADEMRGYLEQDPLWPLAIDYFGRLEAESATALGPPSVLDQTRRRFP